MKPLGKRPTVDRITISKEILWRAAPREGFNDLLGRPLSSRILGNVEVQNLPSRMGKHNHYKEELESDRRYDEEIDRYQVMHMILQERLPCWRGRLAGADTVFVYR